MAAPEFSLVMPTYNRREALQACLEHLERLRYPRHLFEVIVVDDGSTDGTPEMVSQAAAGLPVRVLRQANAGAGAARNRGIREARGEFVLFVDDDVLVHEDLLAEHHEAHRAEPKLLVRGPVINIPALPPPALPPPAWRHWSRNYLCTSNASLRRDLLLEAGLFDPSFERWEDAELGVRLKRLGVRMRFRPRAMVYHLKPPVDLQAQLRTAAADGRSAAALYRRYPSFRMRLRSGLHPLNELRSRLLTAPPVLGLLRRVAPGVARSLQVEREYLRAGREFLGRQGETDGEHGGPVQDTRLPLRGGRSAR